jgi:uncharacterized UBP type Zn finger protein
MDPACTHLDTLTDAEPSSPGCEDCVAAGERSWVHLRMCRACGHVGCCNNSPGLHATAHFQETGHPLIQSYEPGQEWLWCYVDKKYVDSVDTGPSPSHP